MEREKERKRTLNLQTASELTIHPTTASKPPDYYKVAESIMQFYWIAQAPLRWKGACFSVLMAFFLILIRQLGNPEPQIIRWIRPIYKSRLRARSPDSAIASVLLWNNVGIVGFVWTWFFLTSRKSASGVLEFEQRPSGGSRERMLEWTATYSQVRFVRWATNN